MSALRRDTENIIDTLLVALNPNDRACCSHQNNVLPLAVARGRRRHRHEDVRRRRLLWEGAALLANSGRRQSSRSASRTASPIPTWCATRCRSPGWRCAIIGTGRINREKPETDQLVANLTAALEGHAFRDWSALRIEKETETRHGAAANYFQEKTNSWCSRPASRRKRDGDRVIVEWNTAMAGREPIRFYEVRAGNRALLSLPFRPQLTNAPYSVTLPAASIGGDSVTVVAV